MLRLQDIREFVASLNDTDIVGITNSATECLIARAWYWKFHERVAVWNDMINRPGAVPIAPLTPELSRIYYNFDALHMQLIAVTKKEILHARLLDLPDVREAADWTSSTQ